MLAEQCRENFPSDELLYEKASKVYIAALAAIEGTTEWLMKSPIRKSWAQISQRRLIVLEGKQMKALLVGPLYNKPFKDKLVTLDETLRALQERVLTLRDRVVVQTGKGVERIETIVESVERSADEVKITTRSTLEQVQKLDTSQRDAKATIETIHDNAIQTGKGIGRIETTVEKVAKNSEEVEITTKATLEQVRKLDKSQDEASALLEDLHSSTLETQKGVERVQTTVENVERNGKEVKITTRSTLEQVQKLDRSQEEAKAALDNLQDTALQEAKAEAKKAMKLVLEHETKNAQCQYMRPYL
jgi:chromosome segregation ATPase